MRNVDRILIGSHEGKQSVRRDIIKIGTKEVGCESLK